MSSNDTLKLDHAKIENRVLADSELDAVSGGWLPSGIPGAEMYAPSVTAVTGGNLYASETVNGRRIQK
jgi:hypothetical protein